MRVLFCSLLTLSCFGATLRATHEPRALAFEARPGQYVSHGPGYALSVTSGAAVLSLNGHEVRMSVTGANPKASLEALHRMPGEANYLLGGDVRASYHLYGRVRQHAIYPGIDLVFRGNQEHLEYDFEVAAGRHPQRIKLAFEGVDKIRIDPNGDLVLQAGAIQIQQPKPVAYQLVAGQEHPVDVAYRIDAANHIRFRTGAYDHRLPLVIDPQIVFDNSFGGSSQSSAAGLARDAQGGLYVAGNTNSTDFATLNPVQAHLGGGPLLVTADAGKTFSFPLLGTAHSVSVLAAAPSAPLVIYAATPPGVFRSADGGTTWTLAANTGLTGTATALAVDASSATTLYTATAQGLFVSTDGAASWRASNSGLTGSGIVAVIADPSHAGTVFASIQSPPALFRSTDFGQTWAQLSFAPNQLVRPVNAIVFGSNGAITAAVADQISFIANQGLFISTDGGNTWTASAAFPVPNNQTLAISPDNSNTLYLVTSFSAVQRSTDGGQNFSTVFHDGVHLTQQARVAVDPRNPSIVYVSDFNFFARSTDGGQTWSPLPLPNSVSPHPLLVSPADSRVFLGISAPSNVFVTKWSADGSQVLYSTYLGGSASDSASAIAVDANGSAYLTGVAYSSDFPTTPGAFQTKLTTTRDVFVAKLSPDGSQLLYSTLLGSQAASPAGMVVDSTGIAVLTGFAPGNFPVTANAFQSTLVPGCFMVPNPGFPTSGAAFVTRIAPDGKSLISSTLFGGSCSTSGVNVALDASGNAWIAGATLSPDLPTTADALQPKFGGGVYDGFLARFNPSGGLGYATYIGGAGYDALSGIALDRSGNIYVTGASGGLSQPASAGAFQAQASASCPQFFIGPSQYVPQGNALVMKLDPAAHSIQSLTYLGAPLCLFASSIAVDSLGQPWIAAPFASGGTPPTANPFAIGVGQGYISKFSADFTQVLFSTYFDSVSGLVLDSSGSAYVAGTAPLHAYLAKIDPTPAPISLDSVVSPTPAEESFCNSAACPPHPTAFRGIAPGELIRILGKQMGPASATPGIIQSGALATTVAGVQVTFDGVAVPLLSVSAQEIDLIAPFELATKSSTTMQVQYNGVKSNPVQVAVTGVVLQILGVFNEDFSFNSPTNPAQPGSVMILYVSGAGQTNPPSRTGQVNAAPLAAPGSPFQIKWFSSDFKDTATPPIAFAGAAPGLAAGILQINFVAPQQSLMEAYLYMGNISARFNISVHQ